MLIGSQGHLTIWAVFWVPRVVAKNSFRDRTYKFLLSRMIMNLPFAVRSFDQSDRLIFRLRSKYFDQYSGDDNLSQGHLIVVSVLYDMHKDFFQDTFFQITNFERKNLQIFASSMIMREPLNCSCGPIISLIRPFDISSLV